MTIHLRRTVAAAVIGIVVGCSDPLAVEPTNIRVTVADVEADIEIAWRDANGREIENIVGGIDIAITNMDHESVWLPSSCISFPIRRVDGAVLATAGIICALPGGAQGWDAVEIEPNEQITLFRSLSAESDGWPEPVTANDYVIDVTLYERNEQSFVVTSDPFWIALR